MDGRESCRSCGRDSPAWTADSCESSLERAAGRSDQAAMRRPPSRSVKPMASQAVRDYNSLIDNHPRLLEESREFLTERMKQVRLVFGGRMLSPFLRPHFVTRAEWERAKAACETVWSAIEKVGRAASTD